MFRKLWDVQNVINLVALEPSLTILNNGVCLFGMIDLLSLEPASVTLIFYSDIKL